MCVEPEVNPKFFLVDSTPNYIGIKFFLNDGTISNIIMSHEKAEMLALTIFNASYQWKEK